MVQTKLYHRDNPEGYQWTKLEVRLPLYPGLYNTFMVNKIKKMHCDLYESNDIAQTAYSIFFPCSILLHKQEQNKQLLVLESVASKYCPVLFDTHILITRIIQF